MSPGQATQISNAHIGNRDVLLPIGEFVERVLEYYTPANHMKKSNPETAKDRLRERASTWLEGKNIHFTGQLLIAGMDGPLPAVPLRRALADMGFEINQYCGIMANNPKLKAKLMDPDFKLSRNSEGSYAPSYVYAPQPFAGKTRRQIGDALKSMFSIDGPLPQPGPYYPRAQKTLAPQPDDHQPVYYTEGVYISLTKKWAEKAERVYKPSMLKKIEDAMKNDPDIQRHILDAKLAAIQGTELPPAQSDAHQGDNIVAVDSTPLTTDLTRYFGEAASPLKGLVQSNIAAVNPLIQAKAREIVTEQTTRGLGLDSVS